MFIKVDLFILPVYEVYRGYIVFCCCFFCLFFFAVALLSFVKDFSKILSTGILKFHINVHNDTHEI